MHWSKEVRGKNTSENKFSKALLLFLVKMKNYYENTLLRGYKKVQLRECTKLLGVKNGLNMRELAWTHKEIKPKGGY